MVFTKVAFIGIGAVGSIYAQCMIKNNREADIWAVVPQKGIYDTMPVIINGELLRIPLRTADENEVKADVIIIAVKWHHLEKAMDEAARFIHRGTQVISLLNGIRSESSLAARFGWNRVLYAICSGIDSSRTGHSVTMNRRGQVLFGEKTNERLSDRVLAMRHLFERSDVPHRIPIDMEKQLWWKLMVNVGMNQVSALYGLSYGAFRENPQAMHMMRNAQMEVLKLAEAKGIDLSENDILVWEEQLRGLSAAGRSSTLQDIWNRQKTEVEIFGGEVCTIGRELGIPTPVNEALYLKIRQIEDGYLGPGSDFKK